jgi:hypothetical protein
VIVLGVAFLDDVSRVLSDFATARALARETRPDLLLFLIPRLAIFYTSAYRIDQ